ncbi:hypothetical protein [Lentilactobacillus parakefiri]|uniref:Uncharacterized protein n=1 Tax=Lentilactobacillus parakefiri TaxID=152332 RepID=A0A269YE89_9LACO|nr:hypothetical protein [Lentilactobacillus parakefiri]KRL70464.1 hypothetical protein FD08_GL001142 [Lentilactobacillus parakefiri DSM 10551]PAK83848.1 hypothetical protein B8W98_05935 [Lentilactobacillus parakefiri]PAK99943.1 hypothetical protein B8W96_09130 [Lentilactobacillus parakefiri]TDG89813.1 hypothetical protein C5L28_001034 [Lentilactobacillus parakefiri]GAW73026.1 hypothetical protein LPKJCM_02159 [Lentilactobacillus parakefiri]
MTQELGTNDLGTYEYVSRVYNENIQLPEYKLPTSVDNGTQVLFNTDVIRLTMEIADQRVQKITIVTPQPQSLAYMRVFEGFEFGMEALGTWINTYHRSTSSHGKASDVVNGILASYDTTKENVLTVSLTRAK